jgi:DNA-binding CsgD family transcriptional regulator
VKTSRLHIIILMWLSVFAASCGKPDIQEDYNVSPELAAIDSLMWQQPDSALKVMLEFAGSEAADSLDVFEGHYCQVLVAELLFKNYYRQINRMEVLRAVGYFDSIVGMDGADTRGVSVPFLDARAHYINGAGYYERDSLIEACGEYLNALRMMEGHFAENELVGHKARFMALTYTRLMDMFSQQFIQEQAIYCGKQSLAYNKIAHSSPGNMANILYHLGKQYDKLNEADSAAYYYDKALDLISDRNTMLYRDVVTSKALFECKGNGNVVIALDSMKSMAAQAASDTERLNRFLTIGGVYKSLGQYDSAKVYLEPVFEKNPDRASIAAKYLRDMAIAEGDTLKAIQYSQVLAEDAAAAPENLFRASQLNDLFQNYLQKKQEKAEAERKLAEQEAARQRWRRGLAVTVVVMMALGLGLWWWLAKRKKEHEAETHTWHKEKQQLQTQVDDALQQLQTVNDALQQLQTQADDALQQARAMLPQRANEIYSSKVGNRLERIMAEFEAAYPKALEQLAAAYPDLTPTERRIFVLSHLQFRAKEMADLLGLSENTVNQYRYNLRKKTENASFSAFLD